MAKLKLKTPKMAPKRGEKLTKIDRILTLFD